MNLASEEATLRFLEGIWFHWGQRIVQRIADIYELTEDQRDAFETILLPVNNWQVRIFGRSSDSETKETQKTDE